MDQPETAVSPAAVTRAPTGGLKLMLAILAIFVLLALYGQWEHFRRPQVETVTIVPAPNVSPAPGH